MQKHVSSLSRYLFLVLIIIGGISAGLLTYHFAKKDIHRQYFTVETIKELEDLGFIVREIAQLENPEAWQFNPTTGLYELNDYLIHPQVVSQATYNDTMQATNWRYSEITGSEGYDWVLQNKIKPLVDGFEKLYLSYPMNNELITLFNDELHKANVLIETFGAQYDTNLELTHDWLQQKNLSRQPSEATGWQEVHEGVWSREIEIYDGEGTRHTWYTKSADAQRWLVDNILKPEYDEAQATLARLGEEEAKRQGIYDALLSKISLYEANIEYLAAENMHNLEDSEDNHD